MYDVTMHGMYRHSRTLLYDLRTHECSPASISDIILLKKKSIKIFNKQLICRFFFFRILILVSIHNLFSSFEGVRTRLQLVLFYNLGCLPSYGVNDQCPEIKRDLKSITEGTV